MVNPQEKEDKDKQQEKKEEVDAKPSGAKTNGKDGKKKAEELSEEDQQLKSELEMLVERLKESNTDLYKPALESLKTLIRTSTSSMTAVPKPLKFLRSHYPNLTKLFDTWPAGENKDAFADVLSVLGMTYAEDGRRDSLKYRLLGPNEDPAVWGHEYVRHLAMEIGEEYSERTLKDIPDSTDDIMDLAMQLVPFFLSHNAEADAVDLLLELEAIEKLPQFVDAETAARVCLYMVSCVNLLAPPDDVNFLKTAHEIYRKQNQLPQAMTLAIRLDDHDLIQEDLAAAGDDKALKQQLAFMLARQQIWLESEDEDVSECLRNTKLSEYFMSLGREVNVLEPKIPEDIYKSHLENTRSTFGSGQVDSAQQNLASTFVNAWVNAGFGQDKLMLTEEESASWIYKNKESGMLSAAASLGSLLLWDVEMGLTQIDKYMYSSEEYIKAGSLLGVGIVNSGVHNESDPALALLADYVENKSVVLRTSAIIGLGLAYAGSNRTDVVDLLLPIAGDSSLTMEISSVAALALGLICVGSCNGDVTSTIVQTLMERDESQLKDKWARFMALGLALLYLGKQDASDATLETLKVIEAPLAKHAGVLVEICSYAGTGNVLKVQEMLHLCSERLEDKKEDADKEDGKADGEEAVENMFQSFAVLGLSLIAMGEDVGKEMVLRQFGHLMHYGEPAVRKAVPLALGLLNASNPEMTVFETLSRYSHDNDLDVAMNAIFAMGIVGAGTNNARLAQLLRQLASYYHREPNALFMVRIAQGLLHMGKGTLTVNPYHNDRQVLNKVAIAGLLSVSVSLLDARDFVLKNSSWLLYLITPAMNPRMLVTVDENLQPLPVTVRVGQAVDVVGQAGRPKTITGFQTHTTPVIVGYGERAELATEEYISVTSVMEGVVILRKNPAYMDESA
ncbi:26S proteasome regulatory subunit rpn1 [Saitoella complicata NRRL Y-17804]|uniref:26S proteasome regulatory subunit RPN1 n=1 Tax=Saitoella complicata (strain BCRC 22490 / CBS 7301 / JCM 7358 / NBRC 10748 / NRRL Y-17804) TaxID=698492 RepID=A0A0E9NIC8_SAICN|nr:26S proteasome regulatory subunit rpn1 [Saitoella complicata NRRL Y-17804]ODQ56082.1 26S proteasome regulatory subunit rpn1 [Saitoella complicata NRRL Y-17804]GAO49426.1 hypothetical protein G7K_3576-t1 [Saitoella complicata NRRL Y-17804]